MELLSHLEYRTLTLRRLCELLQTGTALPKKTVVLTFDDGYRNNFSLATPILKKYGFVATVFVVSGYVGKRMVWTKTPDIPDLELASWDELEEMLSAGIDIQPHTMTHPNLVNLSSQQASDEIIASKHEIESRLGCRAELFAYPYGAYNSKLMAMIKDLGFRGAVTTEAGLALAGHDVYALRRINVTGISGDDRTKMIYFRCCLNGSVVWYRRLKKMLPWLVRTVEPPRQPVADSQPHAITTSTPEPREGSNHAE